MLASGNHYRRVEAEEGKGNQESLAEYVEKQTWEQAQRMCKNEPGRGKGQGKGRRQKHAWRIREQQEASVAATGWLRGK